MGSMMRYYFILACGGPESATNRVTSYRSACGILTPGRMRAYYDIAPRFGPATAYRSQQVNTRDTLAYAPFYVLYICTKSLANHAASRSTQRLMSRGCHWHAMLFVTFTWAWNLLFNV